MNVHVLLFAEAKAVAGESSLHVRLPDSASVGDLRAELRRRFPAQAALLGRSAIAVNQRMVGDLTLLQEHDEVAWVPPVSGG